MPLLFKGAEFSILPNFRCLYQNKQTNQKKPHFIKQSAYSKSTQYTGNTEAGRKKTTQTDFTKFVILSPNQNINIKYAKTKNT